MAADLTGILRVAANSNALGNELSWSQRLPSPESLQTRCGLSVVVVVGRDLSVQVLDQLTGRELAFGAVSFGTVAWESLDVARLCETAEGMVIARIRDVMRLFRRGYVPYAWIEESRRMELRHVA